MGALTVFARVVTGTNLWVARIMHWAVLALFILLLWDVVMRYVTNSPIQCHSSFRACCSASTPSSAGGICWPGESM